MNEMNKTRPFATTLIGSVCFALASTSSAQSDAPGNENDKLAALEEVVVSATGTSIRGIAPIGSPVMSVSKEDLLISASLDTTEFIRNLPQGSGLAPQEVSDEGGNVGRADGVNLRGLGRNATLVLFDGHRLVGQGVTEAFADPNQLPVSAIKRVEIVPDAASSIYGSDAVAGVVNYILQDDYEGVEINLRQTESLYSATTIDALAGLTWDGGNAWIGVMHEDRGSFLRNESDYLLDDLTRFGGPDNRTAGRNSVPGAGAHIVSSGTIYGVPDTGGAIPTAADVLALEDQYDLADSADYTEYWPERERLSVSFRARQDLFDGRGTLSLTGIYSERESDFVQYNTFDAVNVTSRSPYWIPGINDRSYTYVYSFAYNNTGAGAIPVVTTSVDESTNLYLDFTYEFADDWQLALNYTWGENEGCGNCGLRSNGDVMDAGFSANTANGAGTLYSDLFNPFLRGAQTEFYQDLFVSHNQETGFELDRYSVKVDGPLFSLPAGDLRIAAGAEYEESSNELRVETFITGAPPAAEILRDTSSGRDITSLFLEAFVPVTEALSLSASVRHDDYSDFGSTTNPRFAFSFQATNNITLRGSWGTAFRAPTLVEANPGTLQQFRASFFTNLEDIDIPVTDTRRGRTAVINRIGNTGGLQPEEADVLSFGIDFVSEAGFNASLTYYDVEYEGRIEALPDQDQAIASAENRALYDNWIEVAAQPDTCVEGDYATYNPVYVDLLQSPDFRPARGGWSDCDLQAIIRGGTVNVGEVKQSGIDLQLGYRWNTRIGEFSTGLNAAKILNLDKILLPGTPSLDALDSIGEQNDLRATANINWQKDRWSAGLRARYTDSYLNDEPETVDGVTFDEAEVSSWTIFGANVTYRVPEGESNGLMSGVRIGLAVDNLFDRDPPVVLTNGSSRAVDLANANILGRVMSLNLQKKF